MTTTQHSGKWYVGHSQQDEGGPDEFDGTIWALPSAEEIAEEIAGGRPAEPYRMAGGVPDERIAELICRAVNRGSVSRSKKTPFARDYEGRKYVEANSLMAPLVSIIDGLTLHSLGREKRYYLSIEDAIDWVEREMQSRDRDTFEKVLAVLVRFRDQVEEAKTEGETQ